jgi:hypothetical protein
MQHRFFQSLEEIARTSPPKVGVVVGGFGKHLSRSPISDAELSDALEWARRLIDHVLGGEDANTEQSDSPESVGPGDPDRGIGDGQEHISIDSAESVQGR